jgi:serine/threonine protein kinase
LASNSDIKPENILISRDRRRLYLIDFGFSSEDEYRHQDGRCGTDAYISPETWVSEDVSNLSKDIWAIAMTSIFICLGGRLPWERALPNNELYTEYDLCYDEFLQDPQVLRERLPISKDFETLLLNALHPNPDSRISLDMMKDFIWNMPSFLMTSEDLASAGPEAQETAYLIGLSDENSQLLAPHLEEVQPVPIVRVSQFDPELGDVALQLIPSSEDLDISFFREANFESADSPSLRQLESPDLSGSTAVEPITPEMHGIGTNPAVADASDPVPNIENLMAGLEEFPSEEVQTGPLEVDITSRKHHWSHDYLQNVQNSVALS